MIPVPLPADFSPDDDEVYTFRIDETVRFDNPLQLGLTMVCQPESNSEATVVGISTRRERKRLDPAFGIGLLPDTGYTCEYHAARAESADALVGEGAATALVPAFAFFELGRAAGNDAALTSLSFPSRTK